MSLANQMRLYRKGVAPLPQEYVSIHADYARQNLDELSAKYNIRVLATEMVNDGWFDGMRVLRVIADNYLGQLRDIRWSDSNGGSWFEKLPSGGSALLYIPAKRPGRM